jgi:hypothetical protein
VSINLGAHPLSIDPSNQVNVGDVATATAYSGRPTPWCNYACHRTVNPRRWAGRKSNKTKHGLSKRRDRRMVEQWWQPHLQ